MENLVSNSNTWIDSNRNNKVIAMAKDSLTNSAVPVAKAPTKSKAKKVVAEIEEEFERTPIYVAIAGYFSHMFLVFCGYLREFIFGKGPLNGRSFGEQNRSDYAPLLASFESFYTRCVFRRVKDTFFRPMSSVPGAKITLVHRDSDDHFWSLKMDETKKRECVNLASYNYLGFAENNGPCTEAAIESVQRFGLAPSSVNNELGRLKLHQELEASTAKFMGTEDAIVFGMGFATNSLNLPSLVSKGCLVLSDEKNHASLILGLRLSGATVMVFKHNNMDHLEKLLRKSIIQGHPRTRRPWKKILIVVEGVYSMEGSIVPLKQVVALKKKYGAYLYLDEAHSVGAMGPHGRGVVDHFGLNPGEIDILMGTFTKSFGAAGGYIAGSKELIQHLRCHSHATSYATTMAPGVARQILSAISAICSSDGQERIRTLARNSKYFRRKLQQMGTIVYGHNDSPVVPMMIFFPSKIRAVVNGLYDRNVAVVGVGFPATNMTEERVRFCISASHTKEILDDALKAIEEMADLLRLRYSRRKPNMEPVEY